MDSWMVNKVILDRPRRWMELAGSFFGVGKRAHDESFPHERSFDEN